MHCTGDSSSQCQHPRHWLSHPRLTDTPEEAAEAAAEASPPLAEAAAEAELDSW